MSSIHKTGRPADQFLSNSARRATVMRMYQDTRTVMGTTLNVKHPDGWVSR